MRPLVVDRDTSNLEISDRASLQIERGPHDDLELGAYVGLLGRFKIVKFESSRARPVKNFIYCLADQAAEGLRCGAGTRKNF